jgi:uncharacterized protein (TIGR03437 family)
MESKHAIIPFLFLGLLHYPTPSFAESSCAIAWEGAGQQIVNAGWAAWDGDINQTGCNVYQVQLRRTLESKCPYATAKSDADGDKDHATRNLNQCLANPAIGNCSSLSNEAQAAAIFAGHVDHMEMWNNCKANVSPLLITGSITKQDGSPVPNAMVSFSNYGPSVASDISGLYSTQVLPGYTGTAVPSLGGFLFTPATRPYTNITMNQADQNYSAVQPYGPPSTLASPDTDRYDLFGEAVAVENGTMLIGAPGQASKAGAVYVFTLFGITAKQQAKLTGDVPGFGTSVALCGDTAAVGTCNSKGWSMSVGCDGGGAIYVFVRSGSTWSRQAKLVTPDTAKWSNFGQTVALDVDTLASGPYVYQRSGSTWTLQPKLTTLTPATLGWPVAISGDTLAVAGTDSTLHKEAVFVFVRSGNGWTQQAEIATPDGADEFASASNLYDLCTPIALQGDTLAVGAESTPVGTFGIQGAVYVYQRNNGIWTLQKQLTASNNESRIWFGRSVALDQGVVVAGAPSYSILTPATSAVGMAQVFSLSNDVWNPVAQLIAPYPGAYDLMGTSVAADSGLVVVGAPATGNSTDTHARGSVYVFSAAPSGSQYALAMGAAPTQGGSVTANPASARGMYDPGTTVQLTAVPSAGYQFAGWTGDVSGTANPLSVVMKKSMNLTAIFTGAATGSQYAVTVQASPAAGGTVSRNPSSSTYASGSTIQLTATANPGYRFTGWSGDASGTANPLTVTVDKPLNVTANFTATGSTSTATITGVVNDASFASGGAISSGSWVAIFGSGLAPATSSRKWAEATEIVNGALPVSLDGTSVTVNGKPAAVEFIQPSQVNIQTPDDTAIGPVQVVVTTVSGASNAFTVNYAKFAPGLFPASAPYLAAQHADTSYVTTSKPAKPSEVIILWGTGFGPANPAVPAGRVFAGANSLANNVTVTIGGQPATVDYAGVVGAGLVQINVHVPAGMANGDAAVVATVGGVSTQTNGNMIAVHN